MSSKRRWGEDDPIFEEGVIGGLIGGAVGLVAGSTVVPGGALYAFTARFGFVDDPGAVQWLAENLWVSAAGLAIFFFAGIAGTVIGFRMLAYQPSQWHWEGIEYQEDPEKGRKLMQANEDRLMSPQQRAGVAPGVVIGGVEFSRIREVGQIAMFGLPGSGKTVMINGVLEQVLERGDRVFVHDIKGDLTAWLYGPEAVLLGPWDERASWWDIAADIRTPEMATNFADALFPDEGSGPNKFFADAAREVVAGLIKFYQRTDPEWSWDTLVKDLSQGSEHLVAVAQRGDPNLKVLITDPKDRLAQSVMAEVARGVSWVASYASTFELDRDDLGMLNRDKAFSVCRWIAGTDHGEITRVIVNNDLNYEVRAAQIFGAIIAAASNYINSPLMPEVSADEQGLWFVLDEFPKLGRAASKSIQKVEELGRSRGVRVIKALQDDSQLMAQVGREKGEAQRSVQQTRLMAKPPSGTASEMAKRFGDRDVIRIEFPQAVGAGNKRAVTTRIPVLRVDQLLGLRVLVDPKNPPMGAEIIAQTDDLLVKLIQPFPTVNEQHPKVIPSERWERGVLELASRLEASAMAPQGVDDDDLALALGMDPNEAAASAGGQVEDQAPEQGGGMDPWAGEDFE